MKTVASYALGCKVNQYESEAIAELFVSKGYEVVDIEEKADIYVINTCTVTNFGDKKSRQLIRKVKRQNPEAIVAVVGCYAQTAPKEIMGVEGVNLVIGTKDRKSIVDMVENYHKEQGIANYVTGIMKEREFEHLSVQKLENRTRAYLKIQDGCSQFCSYCIIPYARGPIRSRNPEDIIEEVHLLAENGFQEIVLTGIHVASYGKDLKNITLLDIIQRVHSVEKIKRIRLSSVEPNVITEEFMKGIISLPKVCDHFHLSLQSGCDKTLLAMNRKYTTQQYRKAVKLLRNYLPQVGLTTDVIVGFPGETEEDFLQSCHFVEEIGFSKIHVFPYSPKRGTPAAVMENQVANAVKAERSKKMIALGNKLEAGFLERHFNQTMEVLFEKECALKQYEGHTSNYMKVIVNSDCDMKNKLALVTIYDRNGENLLGKITY